MRGAALLALALPILSACAGFAPLSFDEPRPPPVLPSPDRALPSRETIRYSGTWNGLPAGRGVLSFIEEADGYRSRARVETAGLVALIYGVGVDAGGVARARDGTTRRWWFATDGGDPEKEVDARFSTATGEIVARVRQGEGKPEKERRIVVPGARGPFATIFALRRAELAPGTEFRAEVFTEWWIYRVDARVTAREKVRVPAGEFDALLVRLEVRKVEDGVPDDRTHGAAIWLTDDEARTPVRIEADTRYGRVALRMDAHETGWPEISAGRGAISAKRR